MITIGSNWWQLLICTFLSYFRRFWVFGGLTGFLRWLSNIHFPRFFVIYTFKRKFLTSYRNLQKKKNENSGILSPFKLIMIMICSNWWNSLNSKRSVVRYYYVGRTYNYFSESGDQKYLRVTRIKTPGGTRYF